MLSEIQKFNLLKLLEQYSFDHLRPPQETNEILIPSDQIFFKGASEKRRRIFYKVDYETKQTQAIQQLKKKCQKQNFTHPFGDEVLLKHIYFTKWNIDKTFQRIKLLLQFNQSEKITRFDDRTIKELSKGKCYCYGHDREMRPNVIFRLQKFDITKPFQDCLNQVYYLMLVVMGYKMVPYHAQKYNMIMDLSNISLLDIPLKYLYQCMFKLGVYYCYNAEKTFIYNSEGISAIWKVVSFFLQENQRNRIIFINKGEEKIISEYIDPYELEKRYGGKLPNLTTFWPPQSTDQENTTEFRDNLSLSVYSVQNDEDFFNGGTISKMGCECNIY